MKHLVEWSEVRWGMFKDGVCAAAVKKAEAEAKLAEKKELFLKDAQYLNDKLKELADTKNQLAAAEVERDSYKLSYERLDEKCDTLAGEIEEKSTHIAELEAVVAERERVIKHFARLTADRDCDLCYKAQVPLFCDDCTNTSKQYGIFQPSSGRRP